MKRNDPRGFDELITESLGLTLLVHHTLAADADRGLEIVDLSRTHHRILFLISRQPGVTVGEIVLRLRLSHQAVQGALRALLRNEMVRQSLSARDKRKRNLHLTERGKKFLESISRAQRTRLFRVFRASSANEIKAYLKIMRAQLDDADREWLYAKRDLDFQS